MQNGSLYFIKSQLNGLVLDVQEGSTKDNANIIVYKQKTHDNQNQLWRFENGYLINARSAKALDIRGGQMDSGSSIIQYAQKMSEEASNQKWDIDNEGYIFCQARPDLVLDIQGAEDKSGAHVILYNRRKGDIASNQRWTVELS